MSSDLYIHAHTCAHEPSHTAAEENGSGGGGGGGGLLFKQKKKNCTPDPGGNSEGLCSVLYSALLGGAALCFVETEKTSESGHLVQYLRLHTRVGG